MWGVNWGGFFARTSAWQALRLGAQARRERREAEARAQTVVPIREGVLVAPPRRPLRLWRAVRLAVELLGWLSLAASLVATYLRG